MTTIDNTPPVYSTLAPIYLKTVADEKKTCSYFISWITISQNNNEPVFVSSAKISLTINQFSNNLAKQLTTVSNQGPSPALVNDLPLPQGAQPVNNENDFTVNVATNVPNYEELSTHPGVVKYGKLCWVYDNEKFSYAKTALNVFIHFSKIDGNVSDRPTSLPGDKWHVSVNINKVPEAFNLLAQFFLSEDFNVLPEWKITDMNDASKVSEAGDNDKLNRVRYGAQFTLYFHPANNEHYTEDDFSKIRMLGKIIENRLKNAEITPGNVPDSDIVSPGFNYISYRNDKLIPSNDKINQEEKEMLLSQEFFKRAFPDNEITGKNNSSMDGYSYEQQLKRIHNLFV